MPSHNFDKKSKLVLVIGNRLVPSGTKPLPEPMLTNIFYVMILSHLATMNQFTHSHLNVILVEGKRIVNDTRIFNT